MKRWEEDDFYASDEDEFMDRTGDIGRKRKMRMKMAGKSCFLTFFIFCFIFLVQARVREETPLRPMTLWWPSIRKLSKTCWRWRQS